MGILQIMVGVTSCTGIIGLIMFLIYKTQDSSTKTVLTADLIKELKENGISPEQAVNLSPQKLRLILESKKGVSEKLIGEILKPEVNNKSKIGFTVLIISFILTLLFGGIIYFKGKTQPETDKKKTDSTTVANDTSISNSKSRPKKDGTAKELIELSIIADPSGSDVFIDGIYYGKSNRTVRLTKGEHKIKLKKDGYEEYNDIVKIPEQSILTVELKP